MNEYQEIVSADAFVQVAASAGFSTQKNPIEPLSRPIGLAASGQG